MVVKILEAIGAATRRSASSQVTDFDWLAKTEDVAGKQEIDAVLTPGAPSIELETEFDAHEGIIGVRFGF